MNKDEFSMIFQEPSVEVLFLKRPQRFLALVKFPDNHEELVYCPNPGSYGKTADQETRALIHKIEGNDRKRVYSLRALRTNHIWCGMDTHFSNRIVYEGLKEGFFTELIGYDFIGKESKLPGSVKVDFLLQGPKGICYLEVKTVATEDNGRAYYPSSKIKRSLRQLGELRKQLSNNIRCVILFICQRDDVQSLVIDDKIFSSFYDLLLLTIEEGLEVYAYKIGVKEEGFFGLRPIPVTLKKEIII